MLLNNAKNISLFFQYQLSPNFTAFPALKFVGNLQHSSAKTVKFVFLFGKYIKHKLLSIYSRLCTNAILLKNSGKVWRARIRYIIQAFLSNLLFW